MKLLSKLLLFYSEDFYFLPKLSNFSLEPPLMATH